MTCYTPLLLKHTQSDLIETHTARITYSAERHSYTLPNETKYWSSLLASILHAAHVETVKLIPLIVRHHPQHLSNILKGLIDLERFSKLHNDACYYKYRLIQEKIQVVYLELDSIKHRVAPHVITAFKRILRNSLSLDNRRMLEDILLAKIEQLDSPPAIYSFYRKYGDIVALTQQRHAIHGLFPRIKTNVITALNDRLAQLSHTQGPFTGNREDEITRLQASLRTLLEDKRAQLTQKSFVSFFYSDKATILKIRKIDGALTKLNTINTVDELRFFVATLMVNDDLIGRRSIGFSLSNTAQQLQAFYQTAFSRNGPQERMK